MTAPTTLHERFRRIAAGQPHRRAVSAGADALTYGQLADLADEVAAALAREVSGDEQLVALRTRRGQYAAAAMIGILQSGRAYVPVDPDYPEARQEYILGDSGVTFVITDGGIRNDEVPVASVGPFLVVRRLNSKPPVPLPAGAAYVLYTSGSTGEPKGCVVAHEHVLALFDATEDIFDFGPDDVWTVFHSHSFDFSVWELWGALLHGGRAVTVPAGTAIDPASFKRLLFDESVTVLNQVPSPFGLLTQELEIAPLQLPRLRHVIFGGEALNLDDVRRWESIGAAPEAKLTNMYGITETTVHVTHCRLTADLLDGAPPGASPIGKPLPHLGVVLVDAEGNPVPDGEPGEMWVRGSSVTHGYLNRDALNASSFVTVAADGRATRFYRSGDHAVRRPDGNLYYLGRRDQQVKVRGFRIELGEVEAAVRSIPGVSAAACGLEQNRQGDRLLVAYIVAKPGASLPDRELRSAWAETLPSHMRPQRIKRLGELPVHAHGKLDRAALKAAVPVLS